MTHLRAALCGPIVFMRVSGCRRPAFLCAAVSEGRAAEDAPGVAAE